MTMRTFTVKLTVDTALVSDAAPDSYDITPDLEGLMVSDYPFVDFEIVEDEPK